MFRRGPVPPPSYTTGFVMVILLPPLCWSGHFPASLPAQGSVHGAEQPDVVACSIPGNLLRHQVSSHLGVAGQNWSICTWCISSSIYSNNTQQGMQEDGDGTPQRGSFGPQTTIIFNTAEKTSRTHLIWISVKKNRRYKLFSSPLCLWKMCHLLVIFPPLLQFQWKYKEWK